LRLTLEQSLLALGDEQPAVLAQARILLALARVMEAIPLLETLAEQVAANGRNGLHLSTLILLSLAQQQMGETDKALHSLQQALTMAEPSGYTRLFMDAGQPMMALLQTAVRQNIAPDYAPKLLEHLRLTIYDLRLEETPNQKSSIVNRQSLSSRETEVLQLIAQGLTNKEIAQKLVIAPSTAKRHTVNIYNKLGISNRAEATTKAYELGIVDLA
jgi:LuxR family maltose regulon positive regulatory protein